MYVHVCQSDGGELSHLHFSELLMGLKIFSHVSQPYIFLLFYTVMYVKYIEQWHMSHAIYSSSSSSISFSNFWPWDHTHHFS